MEIQQLKYIVALARERHFLKAADSVHVTQPTLSLQIQKAEKELGTSLFERSPGNARLTPAGERFLPHAIRALESLESGLAEVGLLQGKPMGVLKIGVIPTMGPYLLPLVLKGLRKKAPDLKLEINELTTSLLLSQLKEGIIDFGVLSTPIEEPGVQTETFATEPFFLAVSTKNHLAQKKTVSLAEAKRERLLILQEGHCFRDQSLDYCRISADDPQVVFQGSSLVSVTRLAAAGEGVTFVPQMAASAKKNPGLAFIPFSKPVPTRRLGFAWRKSGHVGPAIQALMDVVKGLFPNQPD